jgi:nitroimidazol reductase NimA-like FMN-containing flavoprotein (pyridoxamine 5'-phosphate oxidase superfamily)
MTTTLREMTREQCLAALRGARIGRVAVSHRALPVIVPVNYVLDGATIVFRTDPDGLLAGACRSTVVAFEIDDLDPAGRSGWSVLVVGVADALDVSEQLRAAGLGLTSAAGDGRDHFIRVSISTMSGRVVAPAAPKATSRRPFAGVPRTSSHTAVGMTRSN